MHKLFILITFALGYSFYLLVRLYYKKHKNYNLPIFFERYYDNLKKTYLQMYIFMIGLVIGGIISYILYKIIF